MRQKEFKIVTAPNANALESQVNAQIQNGFQVQGGLVLQGGNLAIAMFKTQAEPVVVGTPGRGRGRAARANLPQSQQ